MATISKEQRRQSLLDHALAVFAEKGYHAAKVEDIVSRAGVARGTFYLYFEDKRATFAELLDSFVLRLREAIVDVDPEQEIDKQVRANVRRALELIFSERAFARILFSHAMGVDPEFDAKLLKFYDAIVFMLERALQRGQRDGIVRKCNAKLVACALLGMAKEIAWRVVMAGDEWDSWTLTDELVNQSVRGLWA